VSGIVVDYVDLAELLNRSGSPLPLAELHGGLCGVICASGRDAAQSWLDELIDDCGGDADTLAELASRLEALGNDTWQALRGLSMEFTPLLPDDDSAIDQRAEALGLWCHGFLAGLVIGGIDLTGGSAVLSQDLSELVHDFAAISQAGPDSQEFDDPELGDNSLTELVEFVRVGAQFVFEELTAEQPEQRTIH
jgi:yecA family protein